jgi:HlyD family secretion protein
MKRAIVIIIVILVVGVGGFYAQKRLRAATPQEKTQFKVATVERGLVKKTVSATGTLKPWKVVDIKSKAGGRVIKMNVEVGDEVRRDQILAEIDPADTQLNVDTALADVNSAAARQDQNRTTYELQVRQSELNVQTAQTQLASAKASLEASKARRDTALKQKNVQPSLTSASVANASANYQNALKQLNQLKFASNPQERATAQASLDQAMANMRNAEANLNRQKTLMEKGFVSQQVVDQAQASYEVQKAQVDAARKKMETLDEQQRMAEEAAQARVDQALAQKQTAEANAVDVEIRESSYREAEAAYKQAQQQVANAEKALDLAKANMMNVRIRQYDILQAEASKKRAQANLTNAQVTRAQATVRAPNDGIVLQKYVEEGTIISSALSFAATGNNILQLGDITRMYIDVKVDETDIANVDVGQTVDVAVDAYPGVPFEGKVTRIDPQAIVEQNVTSIPVRVEIDNSAPTYRLLKPGMNATCEFVINKKEDVINVPTEAIRTDDKGKFVEIANGGKPAPVDPASGGQPDPDTLVDVNAVRRDVQTELEGNDSVEVIEGLKEGERIITTKIEPVPQTAGSPFGGGGIPRMGGGGGRR